jgi:Raf kinase inhibitor-like YbhB/YbcL family protein
MPLTLTTPSFVPGGDIPVHHTCDGNNASPQLTWTGAPQETKSFALIMDDPDAPAGTFTHWVLFDIPAARTDVPADFRDGTFGISGKNQGGTTAYMGPCPPSGTHRYFFRLMALDVPSLGLGAGASRKQVEEAMAAHVIGTAELIGRYARRA